MKTKTTHYPAIALTAILIALVSFPMKDFVSFIVNPQVDKRQQFEQFMLKAYAQAPAMKNNKHDKGLDQPGAAAFQEYLMTLDPETGSVPRHRLLDAYRETKRMESLKSTNDITWQGTGAEMGGRTRALMFDPNDPDTKKVWAGGVTGGLWTNDDITNPLSSWIPVSDFWPVLSIRCITYDPNNTNVFYVGTGEPETALITYRESSGLGQGIWKTEDGGETWAQLPSTETFVYITDILVRDESGTSVIYAGVVSGQYHGSHNSEPSNGLYRSDDGGDTWEQVLPLIAGTDDPYSPADIVMGPTGRIFVGSRPNQENEGGAVILYSDDGLPGGWVVNTDYQTIIENDPDYPLPGRVVMAASESDENVVYALVASGYIRPSNGFKYFYCYHILRSDDMGDTWTEKSLPQDLTSGNNFATIAWHALDIGVDPNNPDNLFVGGLDVHHSTNGGNSWFRVSDWAEMYNGGTAADYIHADQHIILYRPGSSQEIIFGTDGGVFYTSNGIVNYPAFEQRNNGYNTLQFYSCAMNPDAGANDYLGGLQDNGSLHYSGAPITLDDMWSGGDGAYCFYDLDNPAMSITSVYYNKYYVYLYGSWVNSINNWESGIFISPAALDYKRNEIYANAVDFVGNFADHILRLRNLTSNESGSYINIGTGSTLYFSAVTYSPYSTSASATIFVGNQQGRVFKCEDMNNTPVITEIGSSSFPVGNISCIAIGASEDTLVATFSNYGVPSVWITTNGGQTWTDVEANLPDMPIRWALIHPDNGRNVMLATETGVWLTEDILANPPLWEPITDGMANVRTDMLKFRNSDHTVLAASHGRGLFTTTWDAFVGTPEQQLPSFKLYPNPASNVVTVTLPEPLNTPATAILIDNQGRKVQQVALSAQGKGMVSLDLSTLASGIYTLMIEGTTQHYQAQKLIKR
jgi:photosystem II stability/assembly factor-like uncharacterized protein